MNRVASRRHSSHGIVPRNASGSTTSGADVSFTSIVTPTSTPAAIMRPGVGRITTSSTSMTKAMSATSTSVVRTRSQSNGVINSAIAVGDRPRGPRESVADRDGARERAACPARTRPPSDPTNGSVPSFDGSPTTSGYTHERMVKSDPSMPSGVWRHAQISRPTPMYAASSGAIGAKP